MSPVEILLALLLAASVATLLWTLALFADGLRTYFATVRRAAVSAPLRLRVVSRSDPTAELFRLTLARRSWPLLPAFRPGQAVMLHTPAGRRLYSLAGWQPRMRRWELAIRKQGRVSDWLHAHAQPGSELAVAAPRGEFTLPRAPAAPLVLVAAGVGITPLRAMLHQLARQAAPPATVLWHACRHESELLWRTEFEALAARTDWFRYRPVLSRPEAGWTGERGRIDAGRLVADCDRARAQFYLCAGTAMMDALAAGLAAHGVGAARVHREAFGIALPALGPSHPVTLPDGRAIAVAEGLPLLAALEAHACAPAAECRAGECGHCLVHASGTVRYLLEPSFPVPPGQVAACCATPTGALSLSR